MYWNPMKWSLSHTRTSPKDWRVPMPVGLLLMAMMGGLFVVFLPVIGLGLPLYALGKRLLAPLRHLVAPRPAVGAAYFTGQEPREGSRPNDRLDALEKDIRGRR